MLAELDHCFEELSVRSWPRSLGPSRAPTPSGTARRPRLTTPPRIPRPSAAGRGVFWAWREQAAPPPTGCRAPGSRSSVHCGGGGGGSSWLREVHSRRWDSLEGERSLGKKRSWEGGLRAEAGAARGELGSRGRQVGVKDPAGTRRGRTGAEAVRREAGWN